MGKHYVNNADFLAAIVQYKASIKEAEDSGAPKPRVPEYIGECVLKIATQLATNFRFNQYTYKDEMILDGIENCFLYFDNFDPEKSSNPFGYYTRVIWWAFVRRINKEKKQMVVKGKILQQLPYDMYDLQDHDEDGHGVVDSYMEIARNSGAYNEVVGKAEEKAKTKAKRKPKRGAATLEDIIDLQEEIIEEVIEEVIHEVEDD